MRLDSQIRKLLKASDQLLVVIIQYVKEHGQAISSQPLDNNDQYFHLEEGNHKTYYYMEAHHWAKLYDLISRALKSKIT